MGYVYGKYVCRECGNECPEIAVVDDLGAGVLVFPGSVVCAQHETPVEMVREGAGGSD